MALLVQKYGGTSVGSVERIQAVAKRVAAARLDGDELVVVVSAMGHTTCLLYTSPSPRDLSTSRMPSSA